MHIQHRNTNINSSKRPGIHLFIKAEFMDIPQATKHLLELKEQFTKQFQATGSHQKCNLF